MKKEKLNFHIILLGQIASGKDTQAKFLMDKYSLQPVLSGEFSRNLIKAKGPDGDWARRTIGKGLACPVPLMKKFLISQINEKPKNKDLIFVGNPRLKPEAQMLKKLFTEAKQDFIAFYITLPDKQVYDRSLSRQQGDAREILKVLDDKKLIAKRIAWHKDQVSKSVAYFETLGKMKKINGNRPIEAVAKEIEATIQTHIKKSAAKKVTKQK